MSEEQKRTETAINKVPVNPDYLAKYIEQDTSLDVLKKHVIVPRFKILQATTNNDLLKNFGVGSCIVRPGDTLVAKYGEEPSTFEFVPLYFMTEYAKWRDLKGSGPMILERSVDPGSELARKAASSDLRKELYPGMDGVPEDNKMYYSYVEHLRFIGVIYGDHPLAGTPVTLSFERGEWRQGKNFISAVSLRREIVNGESKEVPLWAQVWKFSILHHTPTQDKKWYGFSFEAAEPNLVALDDAESMRLLHEQYKDLAAKQQLTVQDDEQTSPDTAAVKANEDF